MATKLTEFQEKQKAGLPIECIKNDSKVRLTIKLDCHEFSWNCPAVQEPDFGRVLITYEPNKKIAETKSLKHFLQQFRYKNAFVEELVNRILLDFVYYVQPNYASISLAQTSRGGIQNTAIVDWNASSEKDAKAMLGYTPRKTFQGGWAMVKESNGKKR